MLDLRHIGFYQYGNVFTGSLGKYRFRVAPEGEMLHVFVWTGEKCFELSDAGQPADFPLSEEGLEQVRAYLEQAMKS